MKPAAPVTRIRTTSLYAARLQSLPDLVPRPLERLRALEMGNSLVTAPEPHQSGAQVVLRVRLVGLLCPAQRRDRLAREAFRRRVVPARQRRRGLVGERGAAGAGRGRW